MNIDHNVLLHHYNKYNSGYHKYNSKENRDFTYLFNGNFKFIPKLIRENQLMTLQNKLLDKTSWNLLEALQKDGRASYRELGNQIGLSTPAVSERIRKLEDAGIITGYRAVLDLEQLGRTMSGLLVNLIIQIIAGAIGGNAVGAASKDMSLGTLGNTIAGAIGGGVGGQLLGQLIPILANSGATPDLGTIVSQLVGGGVAGAVVTSIVGAIRNKTA